MRRVVALAQSGFEGLRWLRDEAELGGEFSSHAKDRNITEAALLATRSAARILPVIDIRRAVTGLLVDDLEFLGMGAEAVAVRSGDKVNKYLTGKTQNPDVLASRLVDLRDNVGHHLGEMLVPTSIEVEKIKLFRGLPARDYVKLTQPFINAEHVDPHLDGDLVGSRPDIAASLKEASVGLTALFEQDGLLMDIVNGGNLVWGGHDEEPSRLHMLDTLPVDINTREFIGINIPFWSPDMYLESLADFNNAINPGWPSNEELAEYL